MSLISKSVLQQLPEENYSVGRSVRLPVLTHAGEGQIISTTSVRLNLIGFQLKLLAMDADLNNESTFSFPTPESENVQREFQHIPLWENLHPTGQ